MGMMAALQRLAVALLIGLLIGLDRERSGQRDNPRLLFAGVRTFPLIALAGAIPMLIAQPAALVLLAADFAGVTAIATVSYLRSSATGDAGSTTEIAAFVTFLLGALAGSGNLVVAAAAGVAVATLLVSKPRMEGFSRALTPEEVAAIIELAVISVVILPIMPNRGYGPWQVLNPFEIWLVVVLVCALSLVGFVGVRLLGENRGLIFTALVGGLVSSTAITVSMAQFSRTRQAAAGTAAAAAVAASAIMCFRIGVIAGAVNAGILAYLLPVLVVMAAAGAVAAWLLGRHQSAAGKSERKLSNPFSLKRALLFAAFYATVRFGVRAAQEYLGVGGMFAASFLASLADVDSPTIAFTRGGPLGGSWRDPALAVGIAALGNTLSKLVLGCALGNPEFRRRLGLALGGMTAAGTLAVVVMRLKA